MVKIVFVGIGGFGFENIKLLTENIDSALYEICGGVDPYRDTDGYNWMMERQIPIYDSLEEFYKTHDADLAIISTPLPFHKDNCLDSLRGGSHVLCEKPLVPTIQDAKLVKQASIDANKHLQVGFQWSFCTPILNLKRDILSGMMGKPLTLKAYVSWPRYDFYYNNWRGKIVDTSGRLTLDSVSTNATSHFLHNIFFIMGNTLGSSDMPAKVSASVYRAKNIESFDTCFMKGSFNCGCEFLFIATHSGDQLRDPEFIYEFEHCCVKMEANNPIITAYFKDGRVKTYGTPQDTSAGAEKFRAMINLIEGKENETSNIDSIMPHLVVNNAIFDQLDIHEFPKDMRVSNSDPQGSFVGGLTAQLFECFELNKMPDEIGCSWAMPTTALKLEGYTQFLGSKIKLDRQK